MIRHLASAALLIFAVPAMAGPAAEIGELAWLEGSWTGPGIGGEPAGETYSAPAGGQIAGHFYQLAADGTVMFYELITIVPDGDGSLVLRLKHFGQDLEGWESKAADAATEFPLTARQPGKWEFGGLTFSRTDEDALRITVATQSSDGSQNELVFNLQR